MAQQKNNKDKFIETVESAGVPGMGPGKSYTGVLGTVRTADGYWSQDYVGQETWSRDPKYRPGTIFKGTGR